MARTTLAHRSTHPLVRRLIPTRVTPNHLTALRLLTGLLAALLFALGSAIWAGFWFILSAWLDRADGELARLGGKTSRFGHYFDLYSDVIVTVALFIGIGIGLRDGGLGNTAIALGLLAGLSVALIFPAALRLEAGRTSSESAAFDPDDVLFLVGPVAWFGWLQAFLMLAAAGAPAFLLWCCWQLHQTGRRPRHEEPAT